MEVAYLLEYSCSDSDMTALVGVKVLFIIGGEYISEVSCMPRICVVLCNAFRKGSELILYVCNFCPFDTAYAVAVNREDILEFFSYSGENCCVV